MNISYGKSPTTAKSTARDVNLYLRSAGGNESDILKLLNITKLEKFIQTMKDPEQLKFKPSTRKEKLYRLKLAVKFAKRSIDDEQFYYRANRAIDSIEEWITGHSKDVNIQRREHGVAVREKLPYVQDPNEFLKDPEVCTKLC